MKIPEFPRFEETMEKYNFRFTGGVASGTFQNWAMHSDLDNHILFFGYKEEFDSMVKELFQPNNFVITRIEVKELYEEHKEFLNGNSI